MFADEREKELYVKRAGPYLLGPTLENSPVKSITHCLAREDGTDKFVSVKVSTIN
jgi:serine/threonine-protein kinase 40